MDADNSGHIDFDELNDFIQLISEPLKMPKMSAEDVDKMLGNMSHIKGQQLSMADVQPIIFMMLMQLNQLDMARQQEIADGKDKDGEKEGYDRDAEKDQEIGEEFLNPDKEMDAAASKIQAEWKRKQARKKAKEDGAPKPETEDTPGADGEKQDS